MNTKLRIFCFPPLPSSMVSSSPTDSLFTVTEFSCENSQICYNGTQQVLPLFFWQTWLLFPAPMLSGTVCSLSGQINRLEMWSVIIFNVFKDEDFTTSLRNLLHAQPLAQYKQNKKPNQPNKKTKKIIKKVLLCWNKDSVFHLPHCLLSFI